MRFFFFFSSRRRHTRSLRDWSSDVCSSDLWCRHWGGTRGVAVAPGDCGYLRPLRGRPSAAHWTQPVKNPAPGAGTGSEGRGKRDAYETATASCQNVYSTPSCMRRGSLKTCLGCPTDHVPLFTLKG